MKPSIYDDQFFAECVSIAWECYITKYSEQMLDAADERHKVYKVGAKLFRYAKATNASSPDRIAAMVLL